jgi:epoxyqueuosine reductase
MDHILRELEKHGLRARTISISHLAELKEAIDKRYDKGEFSEEFYRERLTDFRFEPPASFAGARTIIIAAFPQPKIQVVFSQDGKPFTLIIPPTYQYFPNSMAERLLKKFLSPPGHRLARTILPLKLLAARSGLGSYGRNNICYLPGMGSYHRLMAFYSDYPAVDDFWQSAKLMKSCANCWACLRNCPTEALSTERFLLHAERCLTFLNEKPGAFPAWVNPACHNTLVGCLTCQDVCPENSPFGKRIELGEEFSEEETLLLMQGDRPEKLPPSIRKRLQNVGLMEYVELLPRNIRSVMAASPNKFHYLEK